MSSKTTVADIHMSYGNHDRKILGDERSAVTDMEKYGVLYMTLHSFWRSCKRARRERDEEEEDSSDDEDIPRGN